MRWAALILCAVAPSVLAAPDVDPPGAGVIQTEPLDATHAYFVPTHPRVTTTVRFPGIISAPDGAVSVFTEDAAAAGAEYLVSWQEGETYLTITPLKQARMANLNVPYEGRTYVFYFYPVTEPLQAVAVVNLVGQPLAGTPNTAAANLGPRDASAAVRPPNQMVARSTQPPAVKSPAVTAGRLVGFLDRLKLIHATPAGPPLEELSRAMNVEVALSPEALGTSEAGAAPSRAQIPDGVNDAGLYQLILLRAVRDPRLNCVGFICVVTNRSRHVLAFDVNSFAARSGAMFLTQRVSDAPPILKPGETLPAYFVVEPSRNNPLLAANSWRLTVELVSPRMNPGAAIASGFKSREEGS